MMDSRNNPHKIIVPAQELLQNLGDIAIEAGRIAKDCRDKGLTTDMKGPQDVVTNGDFASQAYILPRLNALYPKTSVLAEENGMHNFASNTFFTVDPIDGTAIFEHGGKDWGVLIGYIENGQPKAGIIYLPERGIMVKAAIGEGTFVNDQPVFLNKRPLAESLIGCEVGWWMTEQVLGESLRALIKGARGIRSILGSAANGVDLITGVTDAYVHFAGAKIWDFAPVAVAITAAGGGFVDMTGKAATWDKLPMNGIFYSHEGILNEIKHALQLQ